MKTRVLSFVACAGLLFVLANSAAAGPNEGGTLILNANPSLTFTSDIGDYCGMANLDSCPHAATSVAWEPGKKIVFHAIAAFPPGSSPRLKGLSFGISYDPAKFILAARGSCADFELPDGMWPAHDTGTAQTWTAGAQTDPLIECYWFAGYAYTEDEETPDSTTVELIPHPLHGGNFVDDAFPAETDAIAGYGTLGIGTTGTVPCPSAAEQDRWVPGGSLIEASTPASPDLQACTNYKNYQHGEGTASADWYPYSLTVSQGWVYAAGSDTDDNHGLFQVLQPEPNELYSWGKLHFADHVEDVAVLGQFAYLACRNQVYAVDATYPVTPVIADSIPASIYDIFSLAVSGLRLYATNQGGELIVFTLPSPEKMLEYSSMDGLTQPWDIAVADTLAYVADGPSGLRVIRVPVIGAPSILGTVDTPGEALAVAVEGHLACVADQYGGLQIIDISDPSSPQIVGNAALGDCRSIVISGGVAYATSPTALYRVDLADPANPAIVRTSRFGAALRGLAVSGDHIYVAGNHPAPSYWTPSAIHIIEVANDYWLSPLGNAGTPGWACRAASAGTYTYVADCDAGLQVVDCSDPANPHVIAAEDTPGTAYGVALAGSYAYIADGESGLQVIDVSNPLSPETVGSIDTPGTAKSVVVYGNRAYVADGLRGLRIVDVSAPQNPVALPSVETPGDASGVAVSGVRAYVADYASGLQVIDLGGPQCPQIVATVPVAHALSKYVDVTLAGRYACIADNDNSFWLIDTQALGEPATGVEIGGPGRSVAVQGDRAYIAAGNGGLQVVDISNPASPVVDGAGLTPGFAAGIAVEGTHAFIASDGAGLQVMELTRPASAPLLGSIDTPGRAQKVVAAGTTAYIADGSAGIEIVDVSDPAQPAILGNVTFTGGDASDIELVGDQLFVADRNSWIRRVDVSDPEHPVFLSRPTGGTQPSGLAVSGVLLYVAEGTGGLGIWDLAPTFPTRISSAQTENALAVHVIGNKAYVADSQYGLAVFDVSDPEHPYRDSFYDSHSTGAVGIGGHGSTVCLTGEFGLRIYSALNGCVPDLLHNIALPYGATSVQVAGDDNYVYIADGLGGMYLYDKVNGPGMLGSVDLPGPVRGLFVQGDYAYLAADSSGLLVLPAQCAFAAGMDGSGPRAASPAILHVLPNPSTGQVSIVWNQAGRTHVQGTISDVTGRQVRSILDGDLPSGWQRVAWDGTDDEHHRVAAGVYWVQMRVGGTSVTNRIVRMR